MQNIKIVWIGFHEEGIPAFCHVAEQYGIEAFITLDEATLAKRSAGTRQYHDICEKYKIPSYLVQSIKDENSFRIISKLQPDLLVVLGWSEILPARLLGIPAIGTVGAHASLLPHNRGSAPINWALIHGEKATGNTLMWLSEEVDSGEMIAQREFQITPFDTCKTLYEKVAATNKEMLAGLISDLRSGKKPVMGKRNESNEPLLPRRRPADGLIDWNWSARNIYDFIRALTKPYPGAFTFLDGEKWIVWEAALLPVHENAMVGEIIGKSYGFASGGTGLLVSAKDGVLLFSQVEDSKGQLYQGKDLYDAALRGKFGNEKDIGGCRASG